MRRVAACIGLSLVTGLIGGASARAQQFQQRTRPGIRLPQRPTKTAKLPTGAKVYRMSGSFQLTASLTVPKTSPNRSVRFCSVRFYWDVKKIKGAKGVRWQVSRTAFADRVKVGKTFGKLTGVVKSETGNGIYGSFLVEFSKLKQYPSAGSPFYIRVLPIAKNGVVGQPSNVLQVYYGKGPKSPETKIPDHDTLADFAARLHKAIRPKTVGLQIVVSHPGMTTRKIVDGYARYPLADGRRKMTLNDRMNIASVNKTISAVALLQAFRKYNVGKSSAERVHLGSKIYKWLPKDWSLGENIKSITFKDLLTHKSGFRRGSDLGTDYSNLKRLVAFGVKKSDQGKYKYRNHNFALLRILIPYLDGYNAQLYGGTDLSQGVNTSHDYLAFINKRIFKPLGIATVGAKPHGKNPPLYYDKRYTSQRGITFGDFTYRCGGGCLHMSAVELNKFLVGTRHGNALLTKSERGLINPNRLGVHRKAGKAGVCYWHNGHLQDSDLSTARHLNAFIGSFTNGTQVAIIYNSGIPHRDDLPDIVMKAFDESKGR